MVRREVSDVFDSTIVRVETDSGLAGYGEVCPLGPFYLPAYAEGSARWSARAGSSSDSAKIQGSLPG